MFTYVDCYLLNISALQITYFSIRCFYIYSHILGMFHFVIDIDSHLSSVAHRSSRLMNRQLISTSGVLSGTFGRRRGGCQICRLSFFGDVREPIQPYCLHFLALHNEFVFNRRKQTRTVPPATFLWHRPIQRLMLYYVVSIFNSTQSTLFFLRRQAGTDTVWICKCIFWKNTIWARLPPLPTCQVPAATHFPGCTSDFNCCMLFFECKVYMSYVD